eukprot:69727_1
MEHDDEDGTDADYNMNRNDIRCEVVESEPMEVDADNPKHQRIMMKIARTRLHMRRKWRLSDGMPATRVVVSPAHSVNLQINEKEDHIKRLQKRKLDYIKAEEFVNFVALS